MTPCSPWTQIHGLSTTALNGLGTTGLEELTIDQVQALSTTQIGGLTSTVLAGLTNNELFVGNLSTTQNCQLVDRHRERDEQRRLHRYRCNQR